MTDNPLDDLNDLADAVAEAFEAYRQPDEFKDVSIVIENSDEERPTLIVHIDREDATNLADEVEAFLQDQGARTQREAYADDDVRVLATVT